MENSTYVVIVSGDSDRSPKHFRTLRDAQADAHSQARCGNEAVIFEIAAADPRAAIAAVQRGEAGPVDTISPILSEEEIQRQKYHDMQLARANGTTLEFLGLVKPRAKPFMRRF